MPKLDIHDYTYDYICSCKCHLKLHGDVVNKDSLYKTPSRFFHYSHKCHSTCSHVSFVTIVIDNIRNNILYSFLVIRSTNKIWINRYFNPMLCKHVAQWWLVMKCHVNVHNYFCNK